MLRNQHRSSNVHVRRWQRGYDNRVQSQCTCQPSWCGFPSPSSALSRCITSPGLTFDRGFYSVHEHLHGQGASICQQRSSWEWERLVQSGPMESYVGGGNVQLAIPVCHVISLAFTASDDRDVPGINRLGNSLCRVVCRVVRSSPSPISCRQSVCVSYQPP